MGPWQDIELAIREAEGAPFSIESRSAAVGGCINECHFVRGQGRAYFVKTNAPDRAEMFAAEAAGLDEIGRTRTVRVPRPVCHGASPTASWIVLKLLELQSPDDRGMRALGRGLAGLHRVTAKYYGWQRDNTIGSTPQINTPSADWIAFWREQRLGRQLDLAAANGRGGRLLERRDEPSYREAAPAQVEQRIRDELSRTVKGDLPAAVDARDRDRRLPQQMLEPAGLSERVDRRVLEQPQLVRGRGVARRGEAAHVLVRLDVRHSAEQADDERWVIDDP